MPSIGFFYGRTNNDTDLQQFKRPMKHQAIVKYF